MFNPSTERAQRRGSSGPTFPLGIDRYPLPNGNLSSWVTSMPPNFAYPHGVRQKARPDTPTLFITLTFLAYSRGSIKETTCVLPIKKCERTIKLVANNMQYEYLVDLGFSETLAEHLSGVQPIEALSYRCLPPSHVFSSPLSCCEIRPLWECGTVVTYFNITKRVFEACSLEAVEEKRFSHASPQSVLAQLFLDLYEDEAEEGELEQLAAMLKFKRFAEWLMAVRTPEQDYWTWRNSLAERCS